MLRPTALLPLLLAPMILSAPTPISPRDDVPFDSSKHLTEKMNDAGFYPSSAEKTLAIRDSLYGVTSNELGECDPVSIIFARGTIEPGNIGYLAGPPFFDAFAALVGGDRLGVQGVPYPASIGGYLAGGDAGGSATLAQLTTQLANQCPDSQIVLSGYSQGAQLVHNGAAQISAAVASRVKAVVLFGDPYDGRAFPNISADKVKTFCFATDLICYDTIVVDPAHLSYSIDAIPAAQWLKGKLGL